MIYCINFCKSYVDILLRYLYLALQYYAQGILLPFSFNIGLGSSYLPNNK